MKLKNKKTGRVIECVNVGLNSDVDRSDGTDDDVFFSRDTYTSLAELNEDWEDYKEYWIIGEDGYLRKVQDDQSYFTACLKRIGNFFETLDEAEQAVKKIEAWKRLKTAGFRFDGWKNGKTEYPDYVSFSGGEYPGCEEDLDLLFGGRK